MKSHIQLNQGWMKNFQNDDNVDGKHTYAFFISSLTIKSIKISDLGAVNNFYVQDIEDYFNTNWEQKFGLICKNIRKNVNIDNDKFIISNEDKIFLQKFIAINVSRSLNVNMLAEINSNSPLKGIIPGVLPLAVAKEKEMYFKNYKIRFIYNDSNIGFVLPSYCHYRFPVNKTNKNYAVMPINDKVAVVFDDNSCEEFSITKINDDSEIIEYNYFALLVEMFTNCQFLISKTEKPLNILRNKLFTSS